MENEMSGLPIDNLEALKESVKMSGFADYFNGQIEENVRAGLKEFSLRKPSQIENDQMQYSLDIRIDHEKRRGSFAPLVFSVTKERYGCPCLLNSFFSTDVSGPHFKRLYASLAVIRRKRGKRWLRSKPFASFKVACKSLTDEHGNFPLNQYHERYFSKKPFSIEDALQKLEVPVKEVQTNPDYLTSSLKRDNMTPVTIFHNEQEEKGFLSVNVKAGKIEQGRKSSIFLFTAWSVFQEMTIQSG